MEVHFAPEIETRLSELSAKSGRSANEYVEDAMATYLDNLAEVRTLLDTRYHDVISGRAVPVDGEAFFASLLEREQALPGQLSQS
jgi:hypothetical protein